MKRADNLTSAQRSERMSRVRCRGNKSTELRVGRVLQAQRLTGWVRHPPYVYGRPDFYFRRSRLALFVDGCFWHRCPTCKRRLPTARASFWRAKLNSNRARDLSVTRRLRREGFHVMRVWEHRLALPGWLLRLRRMLQARPLRGAAI